MPDDEILLVEGTTEPKKERIEVKFTWLGGGSCTVSRLVNKTEISEDVINEAKPGDFTQSGGIRIAYTVPAAPVHRVEWVLSFGEDKREKLVASGRRQKSDGSWSDWVLLDKQDEEIQAQWPSSGGL